MVNVMNSEISNVIKISPVTVVKADKQAEERAHPSIGKESGDSAISNTQPTAEGSVNAQTLNKADDKRKKDSKPDAETVKNAVDQGNELLQAVRRNLQFKVDDATHEMVVKIVDSDSGEVVRQIPSEEMLELVKRMKKLEGRQGPQGFMLQDRA